MLQVGDKVPDFTLPLAKADGTRDPVPFSQVAKDAPVLLVFYPIAFSGVCTPNMCDMSNDLQKLQGLGVRTVVGFSTDAPQVNVAFAKYEGIKVPIYSDPNREVVDKIWSTAPTGPVKNTATRGWMVVDRDGKVAATYTEKAQGEWSGVKLVEEALAKLQK